MKLLNIVKRGIQRKIWNFFWNNFQLPQIVINELCQCDDQSVPEITEKLCIPPYMGDVSFRDYSFMISLVKTRKPRVILELGTAHGTTVANICRVSNAKVFTVNALPEQIEGSIVTYTLTKDEIGCIYRKYGYHDRVVQIYENTRNLEILDWVDPKVVEFAIVDACHDSEFVVNDFLKVLPSISDKAIVLFHDTNPSLDKHLIDSYIGCMYLRKLGFNVKHLKDSSWAVWMSDDPKTKLPLSIRIINAVYLKLACLILSDREKDIRRIRWYASGFIRGKFTELDLK